MPRTYGLTGPISEDLPEEENLIQTRKLLDTMKSYNVYENNLELEHRYYTYFFQPCLMLHHLEKDSVQAVDCIAPLTSEKFQNALFHLQRKGC